MRQGGQLVVIQSQFEDVGIGQACHRPDTVEVDLFGTRHEGACQGTAVLRVHPEYLEAQQIPDARAEDPEFWAGRMASIREHEAHLARSGTIIRKFFLNVSKEEQAERFRRRIDRPDKDAARDIFSKYLTDDVPLSKEDFDTLATGEEEANICVSLGLLLKAGVKNLGLCLTLLV